MMELLAFIGVVVSALMVGLIAVVWLFWGTSVPQPRTPQLPATPVGKVETHTYEKAGIGGYFHSGFSMDTMDKHIEKMIAGGWELLTSTSNTTSSYGLGRGLVGGALLGPLGLLAGKGGKKNTTITVSFIKKR